MVLHASISCLSSAECTAEEVFRYVGPHAVFASGSPFNDVDLGKLLFTFFWNCCNLSWRT